MAFNTLLLFLLPSVLVLGTVVATYSEERWEAEQDYDEISSSEKVRCPPTEVYSKCHAHCQRNCSNINELPSYCLLSNDKCVSGCVCAGGLVRAPSGECVTPRECPTANDKCPRGQHFDQCEYHCQRNCSNYRDPIIICTKQCQPGCVCNEGTVRESTLDSKCIKIEECPSKEAVISESSKKCPPGQHFDTCRYHCQRNCSNYRKPVIICPRICIPGCVCNDGTVRESTSDSKCVKTEECPSKESEIEEEKFCPPNEEYSACKALCEPDCKHKETPRSCLSFCSSGCKCSKGYVRGPKGTCIEPKECPEDDNTHYPVDRVCPENEKWTRCSGICQKNCTNIEKPIPCPLICIRGCTCEKGLIRGHDGKCIEKEKCPKENAVQEEEALESDEISSIDEEEGVGIVTQAKSFCPPHETFVACYGHCEKDCSTRNKTFVPCQRVCVSSCRCTYGWVRGPQGTCIKPEKCPAKDNTKYPVKRKCPRNEHWETATAHCQNNCTNLDKVIPCPSIIVPGCVCNKGLFRGKDGKCIPRNQCPKKTENAEEISAEISLSELENASEEVEDLLDIHQDAQKGKHFCPPHEFFVACHGHCEKDCGNKNSPLSCPRYCVSSCRCVHGWVRGPEGTCIRPNKCPKNDTTKYPVERKCPKDERWDTATAHCQSNCTHPLPVPCLAIAVSGCVCKKGFFRRDDGKCVPKRQCPKRIDMAEEFQQSEESEDASAEIDSLRKGPSFCPSHEKFVRCYGHCEKDCGNKKRSNCPKFCVSECKCLHGFVRGPEGKCIKPDKCPENDTTKYPVQRVCPENEHWDTSTAHCQKDCRSKNKPHPCPHIAIAGCVCNKGFFRIRSGKCVPEDQCDKQKEMAEEVIDSSVDEEDASAEIEDASQEAAQSFCPPNEFFVKCYGHCEQDCSSKNTSLVPCRRVCVSECKCKYGFVRGPKGTCILPEKCPKNDTTKYPVKRVCPKGERWDASTAHCQKNCTNLHKPIPCPSIAVGGCVCNRGLYRGKDGKCIPRNQCPKKVSSIEEDAAYEEEEEAIASEESAQAAKFCPPNESFVACYAHCEKDCSTRNSSVIECKRNLCVSSCRCLWGWVRGPKGTCIKPESCPKKDSTKYPVKRVCPKDERWDPSTAHCSKNCTTLHKTIPCPKIVQGGCVCNKGLYRGKDGKCIPQNKCPKKTFNVEEDAVSEEVEDASEELEPAKNFCPPQELFVPCYAHCEKDCSNRNITVIPCNRHLCVSSCRCLWGLVRGPDGRCIRPDYCPKNDSTKYPVKRVCPKDEHWDSSTAHCQKNCTTLHKDIPCPRIAVGGCVCNKGLYRGKDGKCIPRNQCPKKISSDGEEDASEESEDLIASEEASKGKSFCPAHEIFVACYGHCEKDCRTRSSSEVPCLRSACVSECRCEWGLVRGPKGTCIKPEQCPEKDDTKYPVKRVCPKNERWDPVTAHCQKNCTNLHKPVPCLKIAVAGCVCNKGLYRGKDGKCIPRAQCPKKAEGELSSEDDLLDEDEILDENEQILDETQEFLQSSEDTELHSGGCPNDRECSWYCKRQGRRYGRCVGPHSRYCTCV